MTRPFDVAIVGFGPSGAVAAGLFAQVGLTTYVCDRARDVFPKPRAISLDHEAMRVFQQLGLVDDIAAAIDMAANICHVTQRRAVVDDGIR